MPIHRLPAGRRQFIQSTLIAGGAAAILRSAPAFGADETGSTKIALLSDTHIPSTPQTQARGVNMTDNLQRAITDILAFRNRPKHLVINGDCAYLKGLPADYENLAACLSPLEESDIALHVTMGNHDDREPLYNALASQRPAGKRPVVSKHVSLIETPSANIFLLDSLYRVNLVTGELGTQQIQWLARELDARRDKPAIVMTHHNPQFTAPPENKPWTGISDTQNLFEILDSRKQVRAFLYGHSHHWSHTDRGHIKMINLPPVAYVFNPSSPNGWVNAELSDAKLRLELQTFDPAHPQSGEVVEVSLT